jgi:hypothetical protein
MKRSELHRIEVLCMVSIYIAAAGCGRQTNSVEPAPNPPAQVAEAPSPPACQAPAGRAAEEIRGRVEAGKPFNGKTASGWIVRLMPVTSGWLLQITTARREDDDLARLTPPWHSVPNPREIEGWHFRNADNTAPNDGSVNAPGNLREFIFSPRVGRDLEYRGAATKQEDVEQVRAFGRGWLYLENDELTPMQKGERASFQWIQFTACLTWPASAVAPRLDWEDEAIARVKHMDVHELDPALDNAEFRYWFATSIAAPGSDVSYEMNDCGEQTGGPADAGRDIPLCVEARALTRRGTRISLSILVGNNSRGVLEGEPGLYSAYEEGTPKSLREVLKGLR